MVNFDWLMRQKKILNKTSFALPAMGLELPVHSNANITKMCKWKKKKKKKKKITHVDRFQSPRLATLCNGAV